MMMMMMMNNYKQRRTNTNPKRHQSVAEFHHVVRELLIILCGWWNATRISRVLKVRWFVSKKNDNRRKIFADITVAYVTDRQNLWFFAVDGWGAHLIIFRDPGMKRHHLSVRHPTCVPRGGCCCISCVWPSYVVVSNFFFGYPPNINIVTTTSLHIFSSQVELRFRWFELDQKSRKAKKDQDLAITSREKILFWEEIWCRPEFLHRMLSPPSFLSSVAGRSLTYWPIHHRRHRFYRNEEHIPYRSIHKG